MSRIGREPITVPAGVEITVEENNRITVKGPKGAITQSVPANMTIERDDAGVLHVKRPDDSKENRSLHGLTRSLIHNMVVGVTQGFEKKLEINGVGYRAAKEGTNLVMNLGYSHQIVVPETEVIKIDVVPLAVFWIIYLISIKAFNHQILSKNSPLILYRKPQHITISNGILDHILMKT